MRPYKEGSETKSIVLDGRHLLLVVKNNLYPALTERNAADRCAGTALNTHTHFKMHPAKLLRDMDENAWPRTSVNNKASRRQGRRNGDGGGGDKGSEVVNS